MTSCVPTPGGVPCARHERAQPNSAAPFAAPEGPIDYPITRLPNYPIRESGFTLIELMVVITLLVVLASTGLVQYRHAVVRASEATLKDDLFKLNEAIDQYYADKNQYPPALDSLVSEGYIRRIPEDPFTKSAATWQTTEAPPDPNNPTAAPGIFAVKSGSQATALDGSRYSDWD